MVLSDEMLTAVARTTAFSSALERTFPLRELTKTSKAIRRRFRACRSYVESWPDKGIPAALQHGLYLKSTGTARLDRVIFEHP